MTLIALQPLVTDQVFMPHMEAMYVPFHMGYCSLICYKGLHNSHVHSLSMFVDMLLSIMWGKILKMTYTNENLIQH